MPSETTSTVLALSPHQHDLLLEVVINERDAIRSTVESMEEEGEDPKDEIERFNSLAEMFDLERWEESD